MRTKVLLAAFLMVWPGLTWGYDIQKTSEGKLLHWPDTSLPVPWFLNRNGYQGVSEPDIVTAFKNAFLQWTGLDCSKFRVEYKGTSAAFQSRQDGINVLTFGTPPGASSLTTAKTYLFFSTRTGEIKGADIVFSTRWKWSVNPKPDEFDLRATATHEIGHLLGLGHSSVPTATMYATTTRGPNDRRNLDPDDQKAVCLLYPKQNVPPCTKDSECKTEERCVDGRCLLRPSVSGRGALCGSSAGGKACERGLYCIRLNGKAATCYGPCSNGACPGGGQCIQTTTGESFCMCEADNECNPGQLCQNNNCKDSKPPCTQDSDCASGQTCDSGTCVQAPTAAEQITKEPNTITEPPTPTQEPSRPEATQEAVATQDSGNSPLTDKPIRDAPTSTACGCQENSSPLHGLGWLILFLLLYGLRTKPTH